MTRFAIVSGICASFVLAAALTVVAQDERQNEHQGSAQQDRQDQARPTDRQNQERQQMDRQNESPRSGDRREMTPQNEGHPNQNPQSGNRHMQDRENERQNEHARPEQNRVGEQAQRSETNQRRISDNEFREHFGREHRFRPGRMQVYEGRSRFSYAGHDFELDQPWPEDWSYTDDCYVDYVDGGYWLFNDLHAGMRIALTILD
jgi:type IV secretory pathway VirB10-like protein